MTENNKTLLRIVHVAVHLGGGAGKAIAGLICNTENARYTHSILLLQDPEDLKYIDICRKSHINLMVAHAENPLRTLNMLQAADAIVINWWGHPLMAGFLHDVLDKVQSRWIFWFHVNGRSYPYIPYRLIERADGILFTTKYSFENQLWTQAEREDIRHRAKVLYGMGEFIPDKLTPKNSYASDGICLGYVGTIAYSKMHCDYLHTVECIRKELPTSRFLLVGACDAAVSQGIKQKNLQNAVQCVGRVGDVYPFYRKMDVFLYLLNPDNYATTENVLLEAMALGLPIIVYNNPIERTIIEDGVNGYIVQDEEELIKRIKELSADEIKRAAIGCSAREHAIEKYSLQENINVYTSTIEKAMHKSKTPYSFSQALGDIPFEWFIHFTGADKKILELMSEKQILSESEAARAVTLPQIYSGESKGSVKHFLSCYSQDEKLIQIYRNLTSCKKEEME